MSPIRALLLDLDDTLLINDMEAFMPHYYRALLARVGRLCQPTLFLEALQAGVRAMWQNNGSGRTNAELFAAEFYFRLPCPEGEMRAMLEAFYRDDFTRLRVHTQADPAARTLVRLAVERGLQMAIVTQPIFPLIAIEERLRWAGVGPDEFAYGYVACYETAHACKPRALFFREVLEGLGRAPGECLMVGDSPSSDMPAGDLGIKTFWVNRERGIRPGQVACDAHGDLGDLIRLVQSGGMHAL
ncbi:MAG: HAD family hydrolase [Chloroflexota bacterium]